MTGNPYRIAAAGYFIYGCLYLYGAAAFLSPERKAALTSVPWWVFFLAGAIVAVIFPILVWKEHKWFTRILAFGPLIKGAQVLWRELLDREAPRPLFLCFGVLALLAALLLFRAGFSGYSSKAQGE